MKPAQSRLAPSSLPGGRGLARAERLERLAGGVREMRNVAENPLASPV